MQMFCDMTGFVCSIFALAFDCSVLLCQGEGNTKSLNIGAQTKAMNKVTGNKEISLQVQTGAVGTCKVNIHEVSPLRQKMFFDG